MGQALIGDVQRRVTPDQMVAASANAIEHPPSSVRPIAVPQIRGRATSTILRERTLLRGICALRGGIPFAASHLPGVTPERSTRWR
jgi:hypothetical protein